MGPPLYAQWSWYQKDIYIRGQWARQLNEIQRRSGGAIDRVEVWENDLLARNNPDEVLALNDALDVLAQDEPEAAELVKLRIFADFSVQQAGELLGMSRATAYRHWTYARLG